jgi:glycosyltransferase involved in cell wall biosynthesis
MRVIFVSRSDSGQVNPFVQEQADTLARNFDITIQHFLIKGGGVSGYLKAIFHLYHFTKKNKADIIHAHYGLSALVAVLSKLIFLQKFRIIITFHGSDINKTSERPLSLFAAHFSAHNILVCTKMSRFFKNNYSVIPCGIDIHIDLAFRDPTREENNWTKNDFIILFSSGFDRPEKDAEFAFKVINDFKKATSINTRFIELKGYNRSQITKLMQAADVLILCSKREGSPQVIKEAILNSLPVIANDVGDVRLICSDIDNCFIIQKDVNEYVRHLELVSEKRARIQNRFPILEKFDNNKISNQIFEIYNEVLYNQGMQKPVLLCK